MEPWKTWSDRHWNIGTLQSLKTWNPSQFPQGIRVFNCLPPPKKNKKFRSCPVPARLQNSSSKFQARLPTSQPGTLSKARNNVKEKRNRRPHWFPAKCSSQGVQQQGSSEVPARLHHIPARVRSSNVPMTFQQGSRFHQVQEGSRTVLARFQQDFSDFPARFQQGRFQHVPAVCQHCSSNIPTTF